MEKQEQIIIYQSEDGSAALEVNLREETVWLDAHQMALLFDRERTVVVKHIHNIYRTKELERKSTCAKNAQVAKDGKIRQMDIYNLDMIISVGYRINSKRGYASIEEKVANLLYFMVRNHRFVDGNNRIAAFMFLFFLDINSCLYKPANGFLYDCYKGGYHNAK